MKAIRYQEHGAPTVLKLDEIDRPKPANDEVLVEIRAAALNRLDLWVRGGLPGLKILLPHIPGSDGSGVIVETGAEVTNWSIGDAVIIQPGTFCGTCPRCTAGEHNLCRQYGILGETEAGIMAEIVALKPVNIGPKPENLSFAEAAALPLAGLTAWQMLVKRADARSGETVLVLGAGSGVGSMGIQIGKHLGCQVIATASTGAQTKLAKQLGADEVIDHRDPEYFRTVKTLTAGRGADVVFEHIGAATWKSSLRSLAVGGRLVSCGATTGYMGEINIQHLFYKRQSILGSTMGTLDDFNAVLDLASKGVLKPIVDRSFPFREIGAAHSYLEHDHKFGKVVLEGWS